MPKVVEMTTKTTVEHAEYRERLRRNNICIYGEW